MEYLSEEETTMMSTWFFENAIKEILLSSEIELSYLWFIPKLENYKAFDYSSYARWQVK